MRTYTTKHTVYTFDELSEEAKQKVIENNYDINVDYDWWESVYEDAANIGLKITGFDLGRSYDITGELTEDMRDVCKNILREHGNTTQTYITAEKNLNRHGEDNEEQFTKDLLNDYLEILRDEYEYLTGEEAIIETIKTNEYEYYANGKPA